MPRPRVAETYIYHNGKKDAASEPECVARGIDAAHCRSAAGWIRKFSATGLPCYTE